MMKQCCACKRFLPLDLFYKNKSNKDGLHYDCKKCHSSRGLKILKKLRETDPTKIHEREKRYRRRNPYRTWARNTISSHKYRGMVVHVKTDDLEFLARNTTLCGICGRSLGWGTNSKVAFDSPTLDRINNERELNLGNIQIVCHQCNGFKGTWRMDRFVDYCHMVSNRFR